MSITRTFVRLNYSILLTILIRALLFTKQLPKKHKNLE